MGFWDWLNEQNKKAQAANQTANTSRAPQNQQQQARQQNQQRQAQQRQQQERQQNQQRQNQRQSMTRSQQQAAGRQMIENMQLPATQTNGTQRQELSTRQNLSQQRNIAQNQAAGRRMAESWNQNPYKDNPIEAKDFLDWAQQFTARYIVPDDTQRAYQTQFYEADKQKRAEKSEADFQRSLRNISDAGDNLFLNATWDSARRGYYQSELGRQFNQAIQTGDVQKARQLEAEINSSFQYQPEGLFQQAVSGASELLGQQAYQWTRPETLAFVGTGAATAAVGGQMGPQVVFPEEVITVPAAAATGLAMGSAKVNYEIESGLAYKEMIDAGVSHEVARNIAAGVGGVNALLEAVQLDELSKAFKILSSSSRTAKNTVTKRLGKWLLDRGIGTAKETAQEVAQEGVTIAGSNLGRYVEGIPTDTWGDVGGRLGETALSSAMTFGLLEGIGGTTSAISNRTGVNAYAQKQQELAVQVEQAVAQKEQAQIQAQQQAQAQSQQQQAMTEAQAWAETQPPEVQSAVIQAMQEGAPPDIAVGLAQMEQQQAQKAELRQAVEWAKTQQPQTQLAFVNAMDQGMAPAQAVEVAQQSFDKAAQLQTAQDKIEGKYLQSQNIPQSTPETSIASTPSNSMLSTAENVNAQGGLQKWTIQYDSKKYQKYNKNAGEITGKDVQGYVQAYIEQRLTKQNRRKLTRDQWLASAESLGLTMARKGMSDAQIERAAYEIWMMYRPNQKNALNRQGKKYVSFKMEDFFRAIENGANSKQEFASRYAKPLDVSKVPEFNDPDILDIPFGTIEYNGKTMDFYDYAQARPNLSQSNAILAFGRETKKQDAAKTEAQAQKMAQSAEIDAQNTVFGPNPQTIQELRRDVVKDALKTSKDSGLYKEELQNVLAVERAAAKESKAAAVEKAQKSGAQKVKDVRAQEKQAKHEALDKARKDYAEAKTRERTRRADSKERSALLKLAQKLDKLRTTPENRAVIDVLIDDVDLVSKGITDGSVIKIEQLESEYEAAKKDPNFLPSKDIEAKIARLDKTQIAEMTMEDVRDLHDALRGVRHAIEIQNKALAAEKYQTISENAENVISEVTEAKGRKHPDRVGLAKAAGKVTSDLYGFNVLTPKRFFKKIAGWRTGATSGLYEALEAGQTKMLNFVMNATKDFQPFLDENKKLMNRWAGKHAKPFDTGIVLPGGKNLTITPAQKISLYLHSLNADNLRHIRDGGLTVPREGYYRAGNMKEAFGTGRTVKLTPEQVKQIAGALTKEERAFADLAHTFFNETSKNAINETSLVLDGYEKATVENYFPLSTNKSYTHSQFESLLRDGTIEGMGMLKERSGAANPVLLEDVTAVILRQIDNVGKYYGMAIPVRDVSKILNYTAPGYVTSVKDTINQKWGSAANQYIENLMTDIQSPRVKGNWLDKLRGNFAQAVLSVNVAVTLKQAASYPTAAATLGWDALRKGIGRKVDRAIVDQYTPYLWYRSQGNTDTELGDIAKKRSLGQKAPLIMNWIQSMDVFTVTRLWAAAEAHTEIHHPGLKTGTEAFYKQTAETFDRAVLDTQPNYTVLQRPDILRSDNNLTRAVTMFQTQRMQNYNLAVEAFGDLSEANRNGGKKEQSAARKGVAAAASSLIVSTFVLTALDMVAKGFLKQYKDQKDEEGNWDWDKAMAGFADDFASSMAGNVLWGSELYNFLIASFTDEKYYGIDVPAVEMISDLLGGLVDLATAVQSVSGDVKELNEAGEPVAAVKKAGGALAAPASNVAKSLSQLFGVPSANAEKLLLGLVGWVSPEAKAKYENFMMYQKSEKNATNQAERSIALDNIMPLDPLPKSEVMRLGNYPPEAEDSFTYNGMDVNFTAKNQLDYDSAREEAINRVLGDMLNTPQYALLDDKLKNDVLDDVYEYAKWEARNALGAFRPDTKWVQEAMQGNAAEVILGRNVPFSGTETPKTPHIPEANGYIVPDYSKETLLQIDAAGVTPEDWAYIKDRLPAFDSNMQVSALEDWGFSGNTLRNLVEEFVMGDKGRAKIVVAEEAGISHDVFYDGWLFGYNSQGTKKQRNAQIWEYVNGLDLTDAQKELFYSFLEVGGSNYSGTGSARKSGGGRKGSGGRSGKKEKGSATGESSVDFSKALKNIPQIEGDIKLSQGEEFIRYALKQKQTEQPETPGRYSPFYQAVLKNARKKGK